MMGILIPYRASTQPERLKQLLNLIHSLQTQLPEAFLYIIEQDCTRPFNRGALLNIGVKIAGLSDADVLCFHDVDLLPHPDIIIDYKKHLNPKTVRHIGSYESDSHIFGGGILLMYQRDFKVLNGFPNDFWGCGGEDDEFHDRIQHQGFHIERCKGRIIDHECPTLEEKTIRLQLTNPKCAAKLERRAWHQKHLYKAGYQQVEECISHHAAYSKRCRHYKVSIHYNSFF